MFVRRNFIIRVQQKNILHHYTCEDQESVIALLDGFRFISKDEKTPVYATVMNDKGLFYNPLSNAFASIPARFNGIPLNHAGQKFLEEAHRHHGEETPQTALM